LGKNFTIAQDEWKLLADRIEEIISGQRILFEYDRHIEKEAQKIAKLVVHRASNLSNLIEPKEEKINDYQEIDINSIENQNIRNIGSEYLGLEIAKELNIDKLLCELRFNRKQINTALGSIIGKLVMPGSDRSTHKYLQTRSGLDELLGCDFQQLSLNQLYQISDKLVKNKEIIEEKVFKREEEIFGLEDIITLYDLTNTYFEGKCISNTKAAFGRSKEKRSDCRLVTLAMVLDSSGFPKSSEVFEGNASEPKTLQKMMNKLCKNDKKPTVVLDAGISSEENLRWLKEKEYNYIVVSKKAKKILPDETDFIIDHEKKYLINYIVIQKPRKKRNNPCLIKHREDTNKPYPSYQKV